MSLYLAFYWYTVSVIISNIKSSNNKNKYTVQQLFVHFSIAVYLFITPVSDVRWVGGQYFRYNSSAPVMHVFLLLVFVRSGIQTVSNMTLL